MRKLLLLPAILLVGCSSFEPDTVRRPLEVTKAVITIEPRADLSGFWKQGDAAWEDIDGLRYCTIRLKDYPHMLGHEVDHCFRGEWHDGNPNDDDHG